MKTESCGDCVYARRGSGRWLRLVLLRWPGLLLCANSAEMPGELKGVPATGSCRNFRRRRGPVVRLEPPAPPSDEIRHIALTRGKYAIVDAADYEWLSPHKWFATGDESRGFYAARRDGDKVVLMHRAIMNAPEGTVVDHINHNSLNNRRTNLRLCTQKQNSRSARPSRRATSRFKGVYFCRRTGKWLATIGYEGKTIHLGSFDDEIEAAKAYDRKARELFGEFAYLNFPEEEQAGDGRP